MFYNSKTLCTIYDCLKDLIGNFFIFLFIFFYLIYFFYFFYLFFIYFFLEPINISGYKCDNCNLDNKEEKPVESNIKQKTMIGRIPQSLCIQLERTVINYDAVYKVPVFVAFPEELDLSNYCINDINKDLNLDEKSIFSSSSSFSSFAKRVFSLKSLVVHLGGSAEGGHFISYRKLPMNLLTAPGENNYTEKVQNSILSSSKHNPNDVWVRVSDTSFSFVDTKHVFSQNAYMLFYERKD